MAGEGMGDRAALVAQATTAFVRSAEHMLRDVLERVAEPDAMSWITAEIAGGDEAWRSTLAAADEHLPAEVAAKLDELAYLHARIRRGLLDEPSMRAAGPLETGMRRILADQVTQLTDEVVDDLAHLLPT